MRPARARGESAKHWTKRMIPPRIKNEDGHPMKIEIEREEDGRWIVEVPELPGVMSYGATRDEAVAKVETLALRVLADRLEHGEEIPELRGLFALSR